VPLVANSSTNPLTSDVGEHLLNTKKRHIGWCDCQLSTVLSLSLPFVIQVLYNVQTPIVSDTDIMQSPDGKMHSSIAPTREVVLATSMCNAMLVNRPPLLIPIARKSFVVYGSFAMLLTIVRKFNVP